MKQDKGYDLGSELFIAAVVILWLLALGSCLAGEPLLGDGGDPTQTDVDRVRNVDTIPGG